ncbi:unnamed protein product [Penicillium roqueforti FM164]|uniref:Genomic scaffold, ProqFM164S02 n=1 Tax=Penicillium roqueforti (strain FM164) TaxID=1365484 RepID=W6QPK6_PENRF|nr:unnamed protein product [Penicillium roqueforti FM164]
MSLLPKQLRRQNIMPVIISFEAVRKALLPLLQSLNYTKTSVLHSLRVGVPPMRCSVPSPTTRCELRCQVASPGKM